ncbi:DUF1345 domain-containing protein [Deinococcus metallilatus]|uniref:DUF1345 domain-containing protein n=1 Tax=Deinococcus metallilatus TaxID=1211322 RepID=A0AAJ5JXV0_9DEIO|nr:DUF1345 domain-containing protein [Deinococcus metallilatus]MBB5295850.1 putative membrane protein [Deinococcus metallilatus]QBY08308.1 DUF1345 domain-containing protein [Deinococcus metallilatus]RXJ12039.1 DUF1345 domain-containing protein [Deinococcus metallilatus]TLK25729.1 DUF1345 domain-containing protein [Deinococcus metallilatus]
MTFSRRPPLPAGRRLLLGALLGLLVWVVAPGGWPPVARVLLGWCALCVVLLSGIWPLLLSATPEQTRALATREDDTRTQALLVTVTASLMSLLGVGWTLSLAHRKTGGWQLDLLALAVVTTGLSWLLLHTEYTLHYARRFYADGGRGVLFPEGEGHLKDPDYRDFLYLGLTIGMTFQVSDTNVNSRAIRRLITQHAALSYVFGTVVVALTVSSVSNLLG